MEDLKAPLCNLLKEIQQHRDSKAMVLAVSHMDMELLPQLYNQLKSMDNCDNLDVILHGRGGLVNAARRMALLLKKHCNTLTFIVPYYCESATTLLALSGDQIIAGDMAIFTPIDPQLHGNSGDDSNTLSSLDIKHFPKMSQEWFNLPPKSAGEEALVALCNSIFPPTLTAFYRTTEEVKSIAIELLQLHMGPEKFDLSNQIVDKLLTGYYSHHYAVTAEELAQMGLNCKNEETITDIAWKISQILQNSVGGSLRSHHNEPWFDALIASDSTVALRQHNADGFKPQWNIF